MIMIRGRMILHQKHICVAYHRCANVTAAVFPPLVAPEKGARQVVRRAHNIVLAAAEFEHLIVKGRS